MIDVKIEKLLRLNADMQSMTEPYDELSALIQKYNENQEELDIFDLEFVSAASGMNYQNFLKKLMTTDRGSD